MQDFWWQANPSLSQLRLVPKGWARGQLSFEGVQLQKITSKTRLQLFHNKDTITYTKNKKWYNNYTRDTQDTNGQN